MRPDYCPVGGEPCQSMCATPCSTVRKRLTNDQRRKLLEAATVPPGAVERGVLSKDDVIRLGQKVGFINKWGAHDGMWSVDADDLARFAALSAPSPPPAPVVQGEAPLPMGTAPKDGTMLRLLVQYENCSFNDSNEPCWVCGFNLADNTGIDKWQFPGWSWVHDYILEASDDGKPLGWLPMLTTTQPAEQREPLTPDEIDLIAADGMRNALGGIYATQVYAFAEAVEHAHGIGVKGADHG